MTFNTLTPGSRNYLTECNKMVQNSTTFDNSSILEEYVNPDIKYFENTENKLYLFTNIFMSKYANRVKLKCNVKTYDSNIMMKYYGKPELVSYDEYGVTDLWYLIMFVNDCEDISDFRDFDYLKIPDLSDLLSILQTEEYIKAKNK